MIAAVRQLAEPMTDDWVTAEQMADRLGLLPRAVQVLAKKEWDTATKEGREPRARKYVPETGGREVWQVRRDLHRRSRPYETVDRRPVSLDLKYTKAQGDRARRRYRWVNRWLELCRHREPGSTDRMQAEKVIDEAQRVEGPDCEISIRVLYDWLKRIRTPGLDGHPLGIEGLVDTRGRKDNGAARSRESVEYFYGLYHGQAKHSARTCHDATVREAKRQGWRWPRCYQQTTRWLRETDKLDDSCLYRRGQTEYSKRHMQHLELDRSGIQPGERYVADHTPCDFWVDYKGKQIRPWLTAIEDERSRCIVGWYLGATPQSDSILAAMRMAFRNWAIPEQLHLDRGRDFASGLISGYGR